MREGLYEFHIYGLEYNEPTTLPRPTLLAGMHIPLSKFLWAQPPINAKIITHKRRGSEKNTQNKIKMFHNLYPFQEPTIITQNKQGQKKRKDGVCVAGTFSSLYGNHHDIRRINVPYCLSYPVKTYPPELMHPTFHTREEQTELNKERPFPHVRSSNTDMPPHGSLAAQYTRNQAN